MQDAYIKFVNDKIDCDNFKKIIIGSSEELKKITGDILYVTSDIYNKHPAEFKKMSTPEGVSILDDIDYHRRDKDYDAVSNAFINYYSSIAKFPQKLKKKEKEITKLAKDYIDEDTIQAVLAMMTNPDKKVCMEEAGNQTLEIYGLKQENLNSLYYLL